MGKHKKAKKQERCSTNEESITDSALCKAVDDLWKLLQYNSSEQLKYLWEEHDKIRVIIGHIVNLQGHQTSAFNRTEKIPSFQKWLEDNGAKTFDSLSITEVSGIGFGLRCTRELKCDEKVLQIPEKLMISSHTAMQGPLGSLITRDHMLKSMPNISLALHLLNEKYSSCSFWEPYIDFLPDSFSLPLFFTKQELLLLQGSPCLVKCLLQIRNIAKLYSHLHKIIRSTGERLLPLFKSGFRYKDFIWAVSCVMSRQNEIPSKVGVSPPTLALIPLWDLCNHTSGHISTFYNDERSTCDCYAQCDFKVNEEFTIFYGPRTNAELLLQQGFVYPQNEFDCYPIKLGLSSMEDEATKLLRMEILQKISLPVSGMFLLVKSKDCPFSADMLAFVRIFSAPLNILEGLLKEKTALDNLRNMQFQMEDLKALEFIEKRCLLLLKLYPGSISEDEKYLESAPHSPCFRPAVQMRLCEKRILTDAIRYANLKWEELTKQKTQ